MPDLVVTYDDWCDVWSSAYVPRGTRIIVMLEEWPSYEERVENGDCHDEPVGLCIKTSRQLAEEVIRAWEELD